VANGSGFWEKDMRRSLGNRIMVAAVGLVLLSGLSACGDDPAPSRGADGSGQPASTTPETVAAPAGAGTLTITADGKRYEFATDECSTTEVPTLKVFALSSDDGSIDLSLPHDPGPFDQDSDHAVVPLTLGGSDEMYQTIAFSGERTEAGSRTTGALKGTARRATTGAEVAFSIDFSCPLVRG
jgi:hypothetical protein